MLTPAPSMPAIATGFVRKLYRILDQESGAVISWARGGTAFAIFDDERLNELILPKYFRGRLCAFRQQLREHGFQQLLANELSVPITPVATSDSSAEQCCTYFHEHFVRGSPGRLSKITRTPLPRRRISSRKSKAGAATGKRPAASSVNAAVVAMKTADVKSSSGMSNKRARVETNASSSSTSTASTATLSSSSFGSSSSSSSSLASGPASASLLTVPTSGISIMKDFSLTATQPVVRHQQPQQQLQQQQQHLVKKNPLFSNESDPVFGDWLSLDDISPATGTSGTSCSTAGVTTDISFSEDVLGALMNLVNTSMSTASVTGPATVSPTSSCGSATSCAAQEKKICNGTVNSSSSLNSNSNSRGVCSAKKKAMATGAVYETHQFSEDTINSMMLWLGSSGST